MNTLKEKIAAQRAAYLKGIEVMFRREAARYIESSHYRRMSWAEALPFWEVEAARLFPMKETRPRVLKVPNQNRFTNTNRPFAEYKVEEGRLWYRFPTLYPPARRTTYTGDNWQCAHNETPETLAAKIELFRNPTEEVEIP